MWWWSTVLLKGRIADGRGELQRKRLRIRTVGRGRYLCPPFLPPSILYSSSSSRFSSPPRLLPIPSSFHESCTRSPRAYSSLRVQMRRQIWFQVARPGYEPSLSARINLTENQLRNNFIDRPSKSPVNESRLKANPRSSASYNRRRYPFLPNRNRTECIESVENS